MTISAQLGQKRTGEALDIVGLSEVADRKVGTFSRGMKQRLAIADVLVKMPRVAIKCYDKALGLIPENHLFWYGKGVAFMNLGRIDEALKHYSKAERLKPDLIGVLERLAWIKAPAGPNPCPVRSNCPSPFT